MEAAPELGSGGEPQAVGLGEETDGEVDGFLEVDLGRAEVGGGEAQAGQLLIEAPELVVVGLALDAAVEVEGEETLAAALHF